MNLISFRSRCVLALLIAMGGFLLTGCSSPVVSNTDPSVDFSNYQTYAFLSDVAEDNSQYESIERAYLKNAVEREMSQRGFRKDNANPDVVINFAVQTQEKVQSRSVPTGGYDFGYDPFYDAYGPGWGTTYTTRIDQYTEGKLVIDMVEVEGRRVVWQGSTKGRLTDKALQNYQATLDEAVSEIFAQFPLTR
jgi:hypothetical protein